MTIVLNGVKNFLQIVNDNWTTIVVIVVLLMAIVNKIKKFVNMTTEEKIELTKTVIKPIILSLVSDAEAEYSEWIKAGSLKRSEVIREIFAAYPILSKAKDQDDLIAEIDEYITDALIELDEVKKKNLEEPGLEETEDPVATDETTA